MRYLSTRDSSLSASLEEAIEQGMAPDGGLYVPERLPRFAVGDFDGLQAPAEIAGRLLLPFFDGASLEPALQAICDEAFNFPLPVSMPDETQPNLGVLELFHGPTAAFKDVGARFLAACVARLNVGRSRPLRILVATSGDTGGAVAAAFHERDGVEVIILYPKGRVSPRQEHQLTCWTGNVRTLAVAGSFDDCQRLAKAAFADPDLQHDHRLGSANSINVGRLLPQTVYYATASLARWRAREEPASFIVPTGNLGNALACVWARHMGLPIDRIVLATNANRTISEYLDRGAWEPGASLSTLASAMDVGNPSNMERLRHLYPEWSALRRAVRAWSVSDQEIRHQIMAEHADTGRAWCPHTATGMHVYRRCLPATERGSFWAVVATAHAAKFDTVVEPLIGSAVPVPPALAKLLEAPTHAENMAPELDELRRRLA